MSWSLVQAVHLTGNSGNPHAVFASTGSGHLLVAFVHCAKNSPPQTTLATPSGWSAESAVNQDNYVERNSQVFYQQNSTSGQTTITFTATNTPSGWEVYMYEFSGGATSGGPDAYAGTGPAGGATSLTVSATTTQNGDLVLGSATGDAVNGCTGLSGPSGWTTETVINDSGGWMYACSGYQTQATAGSDTYAPTSTGSTDYTSLIIAFPVASGGTSITLQATGGALAAPSGKLVAQKPLSASVGALSGPTALLIAQKPLHATCGPLAAPSATLHVGNASITLISTVSALANPIATLVVQKVLRATGAGLAAPQATLVAQKALHATGGGLAAAQATMTVQRVLRATVPSGLFTEATLNVGQTAVGSTPMFPHHRFGHLP